MITIHIVFFAQHNTSKRKRCGETRVQGWRSYGCGPSELPPVIILTFLTASTLPLILIHLFQFQSALVTNVMFTRMRDMDQVINAQHQDPPRAAADGASGFDNTSSDSLREESWLISSFVSTLFCFAHHLFDQLPHSLKTLFFLFYLLIYFHLCVVSSLSMVIVMIGTIGNF